MTQQANINTVYLILQGIKKFQVIYFKKDTQRTSSIQVNMGLKNIKIGPILKIKRGGHQLQGVVVDNIQLKKDWNLENAIQSQDSGMTTIQFDNMEYQNTSIREKRDTLQMIENIPTFMSSSNPVKSVNVIFISDQPNRNAPNC